MPRFLMGAVLAGLCVWAGLATAQFRHVPPQATDGAPRPLPVKVVTPPSLQPVAVDTRKAPPPAPPVSTTEKDSKDTPIGELGLDILSREYPEGLDGAVPVCLQDVLRLAVVGNLDVVQARLAVQRARVGLLVAGSRYLPNLGLGASYVMHDGAIQNTLGNISIVNRDSLFTGMQTAVSFNVSEAIFAIPTARRLLLAARFGQARVENDVLQRAADAYFNALRARRQLARLDETLEFLTSEEFSPLRARSKGLLPLIKAFVKAGTGLPSDQARVEADVVRRTAERVRALEDVRNSSAELARILHLDPTVFLVPVDDFRWPIPVPGEEWQGQPLEVLVAEALRARPELAENAAFIDAQVARYRAAKWRPLTPVVFSSLAWGAFGGGPSIVGRTATGGNILGNSGVIDEYKNRLDIEIGLQWRLDGLGLGNYAAIRDRRLAVEQAQVRQMQIQDRIMSEVVRTHESIRRARQRVQVCRAGLFDTNNKPTGAIYRSLYWNFLRINKGQGLPLEVLDSTRRLSDVLGVYSDALTDYDRARFRLITALGLTGLALEAPPVRPADR